MTPRVELQEFFCRHCNDGQGGYLRLRLNMGLNRAITLTCPKCGEKHSRIIKEGLIYESGTAPGPVENLFVPLSSWSDTPVTQAMRAAMDELRELEQEGDGNNPLNCKRRRVSHHRVPQLRNAAPIRHNRDIIDEAWADRYLLPDSETQ